MSGVNFGKGTSVFFILSLLRPWTVWWERGRSCFALLLSLKSRDHGNVSENGPVSIASSSGEEPVWAGCSCTLTRQKLESKVHFLLQQEESIFPLKMFLVVQHAWETRKLIKLWFTSTYRNKTEGLWNVLKIDISTVYFETYFNKTPPDILVWIIIIMWGMFQLNYSFQAQHPSSYHRPCQLELQQPDGNKHRFCFLLTPPKRFQALKEEENSNCIWWLNSHTSSHFTVSALCDERRAGVGGWEI